MKILNNKQMNNTITELKNTLCKVPQLCPTLCDPWTVDQQSPLSMKILQARILEWVAIPSFRGSSQSRYQTQVPCTAGAFFTIWATSPVQSLSPVQLLATPWAAAHQASLSIANSWSLLKLMSTESVIPSNHLILCHPLLLLPSIFPSIRVFSNESVLPIRWPKYWSFSFSISPSNEYSALISFRID